MKIVKYVVSNGLKMRPVRMQMAKLQRYETSQINTERFYPRTIYFLNLYIFIMQNSERI